MKPVFQRYIFLLLLVLLANTCVVYHLTELSELNPITWIVATSFIIIILGIIFWWLISRSFSYLRKEDTHKIGKLMAGNERLMGIIRNISDGIVVTNFQHRVILVNPSSERILGIKKRDLLGKDFLEGTGKDEIFRLIEETFKTGENHSKLLELALQDKTKRSYSTISTPIESEGEMFGVVTILRDVTELTDLDKMKSEFVSVVSHELRTPLTSIKMGVELILEKVPGDINPDQENLLRAAKEDCDRLIRLVNNLLDLSRVESGRIKMKTESINLVSIVEEVIYDLKKLAKERGITLKSDIKSGTIRINADRDRIKEVLTNLVNNAIKFTDKKGRITIAAEEKDTYTDISVSDTGVGIAKDKIDKIWEKFSRIEKGYAYQAEGTGLGLAICKEIIEAHKGKIWVESELYKGSKFTFRLPK